jgi:Transglutaminase-like superfamily
MKPRTMRRVFLREAAVTLLLARFAVRFLPSARLFNWADRPAKRVYRFAVDDVNWVAWAIEHSATLRGMDDALCLPRALAAHAMLRRRGIASRLCLGVARTGDEIAAHAWIEVGERKIVGGDDAGRFTQLAAFGGVR